MKNVRKICLLIAGFSIAVMVFFFVVRTQESPIATELPASEFGKVEKPARVSIRSQESVVNFKDVPKIIQADVKNDVLSEYNASTNGRSFVLSAWNKPEQGGKYYASRLVDRCSGVKKMSGIIENPQPDSSQIKPENQVKAIAATNRLFFLCGQFTEEDFKKYSGSALFSDQAQNDALVKLHMEFSKAKSSGDEAARKKAISSIIDAADPLFIDEVGARFSMDSKTKEFYLNGKSYAPKESEELLTAFYLLPCGLGLNCDATDPMLAMACASGADCYDSRFEKAKAEMVGGNTEKYKRAVELYEAMVSAFKKKDTSFFMRPTN